MKKSSVLWVVFLAVALSVCAKDVRPSEKVPYRGYKLVWSDEFDGDKLDRSKWVVLDEYVTKKDYLYFRNHPDNVRVEDGHLVIEAHDVNILNPQLGRAWKPELENDIRFTQKTIPLTSGRVQTADKNEVLASWKYGRIDVHARLSKVKGTHSAIWTMGEHHFDVNWPRCGEIDILEFLGSSPSDAWNVVHRSNEKGADVGADNKGQGPGSKLSNGSFHTFSIEWTERGITWYCDGKKTFQYRVADADIKFEHKGKEYGNPFQMPHFLILDMTIGGWGGEWKSNDLPARMEVDWVRVYQKE